MASKWPKIVLIGDSLTQFGYSKEGCWVSLLSDHFQRKADVINRGFSGYTSNTFRQIMPAVLDERTFDGAVAATLFLGANDANDKDVNPVQHVPLEEYKTNMRVIIRDIVSKGLPASKLVLIPTPPNDPAPWKAFLEARDGIALSAPPKNNELNRKYYEAGLEIAKEFNLDAVELWDALDGAENFCDGLHFSAAGSEALFKLLLPKIEAKTGDLPMQQPEWKAMTYKKLD